MNLLHFVLYAIRATSKRNLPALVLVLIFNNLVIAQNSSYNANALGIGGSYSTAFGYQTLSGNTGANNTAGGAYSLNANNSGISNVATGTSALRLNISGNYNTASGHNALYYNNADNNNAYGYNALFSNTSGTDNVADGYEALYANTSSFNTASGSQALHAHVTGNYNTAHGSNALYSNITGAYNVAVGSFSLYQLASGNGNTAMGFQALYNIRGSNNTAIGSNAGAQTGQGDGNIFIGYNAGYAETGSNKLYISNDQAKTIIYGDIATGQVLLGNPNPAGYVFKGTRTLNVTGGIIADSMRVALTNTWSDYVFASGYQLRSPAELEKYIKANKHLPNIPSAEEVSKNGIDIAGMNAKLLEKIEELDLYVIQLQKQSDLQQKQIDKLLKNKRQ